MYCLATSFLQSYEEFIAPWNETSILMHIFSTYSIWQRRLILWTQDSMYVARDDVLIDTVPLHEIMSVEEMHDEVETSRNPQSAHVKPSPTEKLLPISESAPYRIQSSEKESQKKNAAKSSRQSILQVKTVLDGFNLGRIYYLKPNIGTTGTHIVQDLLSAVRIAKKNAERKSRFQQSQDAVRSVQESIQFQVMVAILIMLVSAPLSSPLLGTPPIKLTPARPPRTSSSTPWRRRSWT
jgi:hypothetical protein